MDTIKNEKGKVSVLKGKTAAGKTIAMLVDASYYIEFKLGVLFFSLEQPSCKLLHKLFNKVKAKKENSNCMHVVDMAFSLDTIEKVINDARDIEVIYIDSIDAIKVDALIKNKEQYIINKIYEIAKRKQLPIIVTSQISNDELDLNEEDKVVEEMKALFANDEVYNNTIKQVVLRDFSNYESYDYFSAKVNVLENDNTLTPFSTFNLSDYFNN